LVYVSGSITKNGSGALAGVLLKGLPGTPRTDQSGSYRARLSYEWSGTVTPSLLGYRFEPESWGYSLVDTELTGNYTAYSVPIHTISGQVRAKGAPLTGITLNASSGEATATDGNCNFLLAFNEGWSGSVTPTASGYSFTPPSRTYSSLMADLVSQDFMTGSHLYLPLILK
jgi:hypothetical protein